MLPSQAAFFLDATRIKTLYICRNECKSFYRIGYY